MTRKEYELIARAMKSRRDDLVESRASFDRISSCDCTIEALADALASENPLFDRERFLRACGVAG